MNSRPAMAAPMPLVRLAGFQLGIDQLLPAQDLDSTELHIQDGFGDRLGLFVAQALGHKKTGGRPVASQKLQMIRHVRPLTLCRVHSLSTRPRLPQRTTEASTDNSAVRRRGYLLFEEILGRERGHGPPRFGAKLTTFAKIVLRPEPWRPKLVQNGAKPEVDRCVLC